jgi:hypothetical protein
LALAWGPGRAPALEEESAETSLLVRASAQGWAEEWARGWALPRAEPRGALSLTAAQ